MRKTIDLEIRKTYGEFRLDARLSAGGVVHIYGTNGSGKTTLLKCIAGIVPVDSGKISHNGTEITRMPLEQRRIIYIDRLSYFQNLDVDRHLRISRNTNTTEFSAIKELMEINYAGRVRNLSTGQKLKVSLATAVLSTPRAILLDEVAANISDAHSMLNRLRPFLLNKHIDLLNTSQEDDKRLERDYTFRIIEGRLQSVEH